MNQIQALLDELEKVLADMGVLEDSVPEGQTMDDGAEKQLETLSARAEKIKSRVAFHEMIAERQKENISLVVSRGAQMAQVSRASVNVGEAVTRGTDQQTRTVAAVPRGEQRSKVFTGPDADLRAYRAGMHLRGYVFGDAKARQWCIDNEVRAQSGSVNELGGVLVPPEFANEVIRLVEAYGVFPADARRRPMKSDQMFVPRRAGGLKAIPIGENDTPSESNITYNQVELVSKLWGIGNRTPNSLIEDSPISLADELSVETALAFALAWDEAGFIGDGGPAYHGTTGLVTALGNLSSAKGVVSSGATRTTFDTLTIPDFTSVMSRLPVYARQNAKWYISPYGWAAGMARLMVTQNGNKKDDVAGPMPDSFLGYPVRQVIPMLGDATGTASKILALFGDMRLSSSFGDRRAVAVKTSSDRYMEYDQTFTFATARACMVNHDIGTSAVAGPVVALRAAAS
ncbi:COG4653 Predicted phage phi-C31 gp36 major capsid-like protein [uncultured Caudovirales phage]|uniref:COG4653 Predicted phage phi-C31 gp36 major capsid-like protein n=1 Tax=uncultured Caudovirales phage TaxID=2100421 RepID=A0A6J7X839_9CAUD|nr:COG4653 Predicted phage phi-C31 gp36 major capsid-like protein [uncultured Caudovirales phage]CAB4176306.1 COG4653 Predicted phage phi-C31 gp36 major capsid-like protein [uncultured Caudovirales phage]CAB4181502.1 COG4653 Predicted phage phi-C31 gp36 major capsid-like protein [uncultured Caudovirales phage]CAB4197278.1 COG4653 Predicted phage phi-C31 gp36 major capsid-like protein [uncultured Caudovirales phage]CAB4210994.1 COG4653 Predicted phage phi-C31 gp36 major capsid-like protein [uncu